MSELGYYDEKSQQYTDNRRIFAEFLDEEKGVYRRKVEQMLQEGRRRLIVDVNDVRQYNEELGRNLLRHPMQYIGPLHAAVKLFAKTLDVPAAAQLPDSAEFTVGFEGSFGAHRMNPRELLASHLSTMVAVEGIVTKVSMVRPKVIRTVHYCEATRNIRESVYHDATSVTGFPTSSVYPTQDEQGNPYTTEFGLSEYRDHQTISIQEMPERSPAGQLPRSVDVVLDDDLVDMCKPGDRVQIVGIYRALPFSVGAETSGFFRAVLIANNVKQIGKEHVAETKLTTTDIKNIKALAKNKDLFGLLAGSIAPSIYGHEYIKKAILLLLLGGVEHTLENGTHIRGDINMLMVGDPSTAKSQLLRFVLNIAPLAINTTGRGSSGVGLTAAVTSDKETGERRLEAGAMVLGDRGVVCIDEFDKMSQEDRVAIHEVMEQQTVTIAKAGIHMSLNARCSVVAAANPQYGQYARDLSPTKNVNLPDSLLSRFDLLFIVLDNIDPELDRGVSDHVLRNHRYLKKGTDATAEEVGEDVEKEDDEETPVFVKYDRLLHGDRDKRAKSFNERVTVGFMKKYIDYAKSRFKPVLTEACSAQIVEAYADLRNQEGQNNKTLPVTARSLETMIRLATAHAKLHLRNQVEEIDCTVALDLMKFALHHEVTDMTLSEGEEAEESDDATASEASYVGDGKEGGDDDEDDDQDGGDGGQPPSRGGDKGGSSKGGKKKGSQPEGKSGGAERSSRKRGRTSTSEAVDSAPAAAASSSSSSSSSAAVAESTPKRRRLRRGGDDEAAEDSPAKMDVTEAPAKDAAAPEVSKERLAEFQTALVQYMQKRANPLTCPLAEFETVLNSSRTGAGVFSHAECLAIVQQMQDQNKIMFKRGTIHRI